MNGEVHACDRAYIVAPGEDVIAALDHCARHIASEFLAPPGTTETIVTMRYRAEPEPPPSDRQEAFDYHMGWV